MILYPAILLDAPDPAAPRLVVDGALVAEAGRILAVGPRAGMERRFPQAETFRFPEGTRPLVIPGLIDTHAHLPQYPAVARHEKGLLPWLERHIFPLERGFSGEESAPLIEGFFADLARHGITSAVLYSAIWEDTTRMAFETAARRGHRAIIGKMMMDEGSYGEAQPVEARRRSLEETRRLAAAWHGAADGLLDYAVSPRFAVTCSMELMTEAAAIAREHDCYLQTHLSENLLEIATVKHRFPAARHYVDVYDRAGLLGPKTLLGHAIHLSPEEIEIVADRGCVVTHCPTSNLFLQSGLCPVDRLTAVGIPVTLGSDVAGGPELNPWQVMRSAIEIQTVRRFADAAVPELTPAHAFHLATAGAAAALGKAERLGTLDPAKDADFVAIDLHALLPYGGRAFPPSDLTAELLLSLLIYRGHAGATLGAWVHGRELSRS